jgi:hypothetical protein
MTEHNRQFDDPEPHVSDRLGKDLRDLFEPPGAVPARVDKAILEQASRRLAKPRRLILRLRWAGIAAAAAVIVLGVILLNSQSAIRNHVTPDSDPGPKSLSPALAEGRADIDGNGRVDILDAFRLARYIEARGPMDTMPSGAAELKWDLNGDGRVDKDDVDLVAFAAVHLGSHPVAWRGEGVPPLRREAILASLLPPGDPPVIREMQGQDALATNPLGNPLDKGV